MGFIPIFLYLGGFIFLFMMVVANNLKNKRLLYQKSFGQLVSNLRELDEDLTMQTTPLEKLKLGEVERYYQSLKINANEERLAFLKQKVKPTLAQTKLHLYWYNKLIKAKPYNFVAKIMGYSPI
jgi:hypothetical protein